MRIKLEKVKVELEVGEGKPTFYINDHPIQVTKDVAVALLFGDGLGSPPTKTRKVREVAETPTKSTRGPQSEASKRKLSASLKKYWKERKAREAAEAMPKRKSKKHLNGSSLHN